jgi:aryl-alcohol dehydrogenase-like predicted oxidoreductase
MRARPIVGRIGATLNGEAIPMEYRDFGDTGWKVSALMLGTMQFGGEWGEQNDDDSVATVRAALDAGINFIDTADMYGFGKAEQIVGKAVGSKRSDVYIATKLGYQWEEFPTEFGKQPTRYTGEYAERAVESSLRRLGTDYIDLYQAHNCPLAVAESDEFHDSMQSLVAAGKIRAYGITVGPLDFGARDAIAGAKHPGLGSIMMSYNLLSQGPARVVFPFAQAQGVGVIARAALANGVLTGAIEEDTEIAATDARSSWDRDDLVRRIRQGKQFAFLAEETGLTRAETALRFVLDNRDVSTVLVGMQNAQQVADNVAVAEGAPLSVDLHQSIVELYDSWDIHEQQLPSNMKR